MQDLETGSDLRNRVHECDTLPLPQLRTLVEECQVEESVDYQEPLLKCILRKLLDGRNPRTEQVRAVRRLVFGFGDTILIAKTGFGKSVVFHAYSILTNNITIQIIPLSKLGNEQLAAINRYDGVEPCLVTQQTKDANPGMFKEIRSLKYTHILLGPEQAVSPPFQRLFNDQVFRSRVRLVAIDECHVIRQWKDFRKQYLLFHEFRRILSPSTIFFACTATFDKKTEDAVLQFGGFSPEAISEEENPVGKLSIIRTSVDRPEIAIAIVPIEAGCMTNYAQILGHVDVGIEDEKPMPGKIPKTVVFIDGRSKIMHLADLFRDRLVCHLGYTMEQANRVVRTYSGRVAQADQDAIYQAFEDNACEVRIVVCTTALGMGMDISGVAEVFQWDIPITDDLGDLVQRFGRGARRPGQYATATFFVPYYYFNCLGQDTDNAAPTTTSASGRRRKGNHEMRKSGRSSLRNEMSANVVTRTAARRVNKDTVVQSPAIRPPVTCTAVDREEPDNTRKHCWINVLRYRQDKSNALTQPWSGSDIEKRKRIDPVWSGLVNSDCHRQYILEYLQENRSIPSTREPLPPPERCCTGHNPTLVPYRMAAAPSAKPTAPAPSSKSGIALQHIQEICRRLAIEEVLAELNVPFEDLLIPPASSTFLPTENQWLLARWIGRRKDREQVSFQDIVKSGTLPNEWVQLKNGGRASEMADSIIRVMPTITADFKRAQLKNKTGVTIQQPVTAESASTTLLNSRPLLPDDPDRHSAIMAARKRKHDIDVHENRFGNPSTQVPTTPDSDIVTNPGIVVTTTADLPVAGSYAEANSVGHNGSPNTGQLSNEEYWAHFTVLQHSNPGRELFELDEIACSPTSIRRSNRPQARSRPITPTAVHPATVYPPLDERRMPNPVVYGSAPRTPQAQSQLISSPASSVLASDVGEGSTGSGRCSHGSRKRRRLSDETSGVRIYRSSQADGRPR